ncbi:hypothetical protein BDW22DRAFT_582774 [Trametopsis cervina]|nr:hypothetical protein BDW22DRAFT_582774 [Trametopsis cervina]
MASADPDTALLQVIGTDVLRSFVSVIVETWAVAIYSFLVIKATTILLHKDRRKNRIAQVTWAIVLIMYLINFTLWTIDVHNVVEEVNITFVANRTDSLASRYSAQGTAASRLFVVEDILYAYMTNLGDAIVLWRVLAFWSNGRDRLFFVVPAAVWLGSLVLSALLTYCGARSDTDISFGAFEHPPFCRNIQSASYWVQFATATVATIMIGIKTWSYRRMVKEFMGGDMHRRSPVGRVMIVLVDTGILYMLFFAAEVILNLGALETAIANSTRLDFALEIYTYLTSSIVGIYPTVVVILVHTQCSMLDSHGNMTVSTIVFDPSRTVSHKTHDEHAAPPGAKDTDFELAMPVLRSVGSGTSTARSRDVGREEKEVA